MRRLLEKIIEGNSNYYGGFILPDGKVVELPNYSLGDHDKYAHDQLSAAGEDVPTGARSYEAYLKKGNIRYLVNLSRDEFDIEFKLMPTEVQVRSLRRLSKHYGNFFFMSEDEEGGTWQKFLDFIRKNSAVDESRIDFPREDLDFAVWDKEDDTYTLKEEVKEKILNFLKEYEGADLLAAKEIHIVGSITSNQYSDSADIDVHIIPKSAEGWDADNIKELQIWFNDHRDDFDGYVNEHPIEVYVQLDERQDLLSVGNYDILSDRWLTGPVVVPLDYDPYEDFEEVATAVKDVVRDADVLFGELKRDVIDYEVIKAAMQNMSREDQEKLLQRLQSKLAEIEDNIENLYKERKGYVDLRRTMDSEQALKDVSNMEQWEDADATFKFINRYRYFRTIGDLNDLLSDEKVTPDEVDKIKSIMGV